jgi:hypothetical protein
LILAACSSETSTEETQMQQLENACTIVNDWPADYALTWANAVKRANDGGPPPSEAMTIYITSMLSMFDELSDPVAIQIIEDYQSYWGILERNIVANGGMPPDSGAPSVVEGSRLLEFCGQFDPEVREMLGLDGYKLTPPPKAESVEVSEIDGASVSASQAEDWFTRTYGIPCSNPNDRTKECDTRTLLEARVVQLEPGDYTQVVEISASPEDTKVNRYDIDRSTNIWCFKTSNFSRIVYDDAEELEFSEETTYSFNCYYLVNTDDDGELFAFFMGNLLTDGSIGLSPIDQCRLKFGYGFDDIDASSKCFEAAEQKTEPNW